ncbi:uncharacterized protein SAPINGB_P003972 [Magnusiomyces paraingens]|uniref:Uncharacterized protein n=1 Tax=Magnusiomyces paraingens TaxID=2606893 RepID=A0A5E8BT55_9ASCO|nr:uncharacterized protein SAPINGB_P003972 [Saprochaete ingens]VVT54231.1 unnamed protein product [Saprochaete ingens]
MSSLESQALSRKERLAKLRNIKKGTENGASNSKEESDAFEPLKPIGKNYNVELRGPQSGFNGPPTLRLGTDETVEAVSAEFERETLARLRERGISSTGPRAETEDETGSTKTGLDLESLQPKRANWDLKRDVEPQLKVLEAQTQNAIVQIVRERLKADVKEYGEKKQSGGS